MPMGCNVLPRHALVCATACPWGAKASHARATACLGVCHAKAMRCQGKPWPATACLGVCHAQPMGCQGLPWHAHGQCQPRLVACPWHALVCATGCPWGAKASHGLPRAALVCATASPWVAKACHGMPWWPAMGCHDMPWCVPRLAMAYPWARPTEVSGLPMGCHGFPRHALVCAMARPWAATACLGVCHDKSCACQIDFCPCKPPKLCF